MSFKFLSARTLIFVVAGRAATFINSPGLNGFGTPLRALRAGTCFFSILTRPGSVNAPAPRRPRLLEIWPLSESRTELTSRRFRFVSLPDRVQELTLGWWFLWPGVFLCHRLQISLMLDDE